MYSKLQYISQGETAAVQLNNIQEALDAGCKWIQLRFKNATEDEVTYLAYSVKKLCTDHGATFIVNDQPHIAKGVDADGVHLGKTDMAINYAREILGPGKIIGGTANTLHDVLNHADKGFSYVGLGPYSFTLTKAKLSPILGINGYNEIMNALRQRNISIPVYAIGGIKLEDTRAIMHSGVYGVAVSGSITTHSDKKLLVKQFNSILDETTNNSR
jgi:thiamine-phosphate pyrophosphorylase